MIDAEEIDMYPALLVQSLIDNGIKEFIPRYLAFSDSHAAIIANLIRMQSANLVGQEEEIKPYWEMIEKRKISPPVRF